MFEIESLELQNVHYFKSARSKLNRNALTFIRGMNLDGEGDHRNPTGNGAGKSLFFSAIPNVVFFAPPLSKKKKSTKELLKKGSSVHLAFKSPNGKRYKIVQTAGGYTIFENGKDLEVRTKPLAEKMIRSLFPLSEIEYYTHAFVSTQRPFPLQTDTNVNRLEHLSQIFRFDNYDGLKQYFATKLRALKDNEIKLSVLEQSSLALRKKLKAVEKQMDKSGLAEAKRKHADLDTELQAAVKEEFSLLKTAQAYRTLLTIETELDALRGKYAYKDAPAKRLVWLKAQKALARKYEDYESLLRAYNRSLASTQKKIDALELPSKDAKTLVAMVSRLETQIEALDKGINKLRSVSESHEEQTGTVQRLEKQLVRLGFSVDSPPDLEVDHTEEIEAAKQSLRLRNLLEDHEDHEGGAACPTCLSEVDLKGISKVVRRAERKLPELQQSQKAQTVYREFREARKSLKSLAYDPLALNAAKSELSDLKKKLAAAEEGLETWKTHSVLIKALKNIEAPRAPKVERETELSYSQLDGHADLCESILRHLEAKSKLLENNEIADLADCKTVKLVKARIAEVEAKLKKAAKILASLRSAIADASATIERQSNLHSEHALYTSELATAAVKIAKLTPAKDAKRVLEVLVKAYSSKGLKTLAAQQVSALFENNLNFYRGLIFAEPFTFSVKVTETGMAIDVDRGHSIVSDVRLLSGAESNCFRLLCIISLLPLIPSERRLNMLVLDEPTAHMHSATRQIFVERYLPALMEVIPNIYIITPNSDETVKGANEWMIVKQNGESKLVTTSYVPEL